MNFSKNVMVLMVLGLCALTVSSAYAQVFSDMYESDNVYLGAKSILGGFSQNRSIYPSGDQDWVKLIVKAGHDYRIETLPPTTGSSVGDTHIYLYTDNPPTIYVDHDDDDGQGYFSLLQYHAVANGTVFIRITSNTSATGNYRLEVVDLTSGGGGSTIVYGSDTVSGPAITTDGNGWPVMTYDAADSNGVDQVYMRRWSGSIGTASDRGNWTSLTTSWTGADGTAGEETQVSTSVGGASFPSVAVYGDNIYVAWMNRATIASSARIFLRKWDGTAWSEIGGSMTGYGLSPAPANSLDKDSFGPKVMVTPGGTPIVCFQHSFLNGSGTSLTYAQSICIKKYDSTSDKWIGMDGSTNGVVPGGEIAFDPSMDLTASGYPVVAWGEPAKMKIRARKWTGSAWSSTGLPDLGLSPFAEKPSITVAANGTIYIAWRQFHVPTTDIDWLMANDVIQLNVVKNTGGSWVDMGGSYSALGISSAKAGGTQTPSYVTVDVDPSTGYPMVAWLSGETNNAVLMKSWNGSSWVGVDGSDVAPGVSSFGGDFATPAMTIDKWGRPAVVFVNSETNGTSTLYSYKIVGEEPPLFNGLQFMESRTNQTAFLKWEHATSPDPLTPYASVTYYIYKSTKYSWNFAQTPSFTAEDVFTDANLIRTMSNVPIGTSPELVYGVAAADVNKVWGFGVRAEHNGFRDDNSVIRYGGATNYMVAAPLPDYDIDDDGLDDNDLNEAGNNKYNADLNANEVSDGDELQLGWSNPTTASRDLYHYLLSTNFSTAEGSWSHTSTRDMWHRTTADPDPPTNTVKGLYTHSTNYSFRCANNSPSNDISTTYSQGSMFIKNELVSPVVNPAAAGCTNLFVSWNEYYETESAWDICKVAISRDGVNWFLIRTGVSGYSGKWVHQFVDATKWWADNGYPNGVRIKFEFQTLNNVNNDYRGWYVDDVKIFGTPAVQGTVRNVIGEPLNGATIYAIGKGGVTNVVDGHSYVNPGKIIAQTITDQNGVYTLRGLPQGRYYIKAVAPGYKAEFWNGQLYAGAYDAAFGNVVNPGVYDVRAATGGWLDLTAPSSGKTCDFEMDPGASRGALSVRTTTGAYSVNLNQADSSKTEKIWNGTATVTGAALLDYNTSIVDSGTFPNINWDTNPQRSPEITEIMEGQHDVYLYPNWSGAPAYSRITPFVRSGEKTKVIIGTVTKTGGIVNIIAGNNESFEVYVDGRPTGKNTPTQITGLYAGVHDIKLLSASLFITPKQVSVSTSGTVNVFFSTDEISGPRGGSVVQTYDFRGAVVTNAEIFIDGLRAGVSPLTVSNCMPGNHKISARKDGYMTPSTLTLPIISGVTNVFKITLNSADRDFDAVADDFEIEGYTNIFTHSAGSDPDNDGVKNLIESDIYRYQGVKMGINNPDSDADDMTDGKEVGYDGTTNLLALSTLAARVAVRGASVDVYFQGLYLQGTNVFKVPGRMSIEGDEFYATSLAWTSDARGVPVLRMGVATVGTSEKIISVSHEIGETIFADSMPNNTDTDGDGMWDGFEYLYESVAGVNVIENIGAGQDPDNDGLTNLREFLGTDGLPSGYTNTWSNPGDSDSDDDGIPDGWEIDHGLNPLYPGDASFDADSDGLTAFEEWANRTDPMNEDTDNDGLLDGQEVNVYESDPNNYDTDYDGLWDGQEVYDTDLDISNGIDGGFFANWSGGDLDLDGFMDGPTDWDTDGDGMPDGFEVLYEMVNGSRAIRPVHLRLDPYNPLDGSIDSDGDGLSNLEEYLVRDGLVGNPPAGVLWDYSSDPFNPDTDGDGMPDGWEVWKGLHPVDPIPSVESGTGIIVRDESLWLYGDLDGDGLHNIDEFTSRFISDPNADPYQIVGSCDPRDSDTDQDGLPDGEEVKTYRTNPVVQDTDGDGLIDGIDPTATRMGEVNSSDDIYASGHYDRAMNDMWRLIPTKLGDFKALADWWFMQADRAPSILPVYEPNAAGVFALIATNTVAQDSWTRFAPTAPEPVAPEAYLFSKALVVDDQYDNFNDNPGLGQGLLLYLIDVQQAGNYKVKLRNELQRSVAADSGGSFNSIWFAVDFGAWNILRSGATAVNTWTWDTYNEYGAEHVMNLTTGLHYLAFSGRGAGFAFSKAHIYSVNIADAVSEGSAPSAVDAAATAAYEVLDTPERRWGASMSAINYAVRDDTLGTYVGYPISNKGTKNQLLIKNNKIIVMGGRDGGTFYNDIWTLRGGSVWFREDYMIPLSAGYSELLTGTIATNLPATAHPWYNEKINDRLQYLRPRPGSGPKYRYYDGDRDTMLSEIWTDDSAGIANRATTFYITGWDNVQFGGFYEYFPSQNFNERVLKWNEPWLYGPVVYMSTPDDYRRASYTWASGGSATQYATNNVPVFPYYVWTGATISYTELAGVGTNTSVACINIKDVLNVIGDSAIGTLRASLNIAAQAAFTGPMDIEVRAEVAFLNQGTVPDPESHDTWSSSPVYGVESSASARGTPQTYEATPWKRYTGQVGGTDYGYGYFVTPPITHTIAGIPLNGNISIDVTTLVTNILSHQLQVGEDLRTWELGNSIGFILTPVLPGVDGSESITLLGPALNIIANDPPWGGGGQDLANVTVQSSGSWGGVPDPVGLPFARKLGAMAMTDGGYVMFGGVDGNMVLDDTWLNVQGTKRLTTFYITDSLVPDATWADSAMYKGGWVHINTPATPPARWGHGMATCAAGAIMFGGFDVNNKPLNDTWVYVWNDQTWYAITNWAVSDGVVTNTAIEYPTARGGHVMGNMRSMPVIFGGTDGECYMNDTWILQDEGSVSVATGGLPWRWLLVSPGGEKSGSPPPRAFACAFNVVPQNGTNSFAKKSDYLKDGMWMFGGRTGALPTSKDTDDDWVDDGVEHALGGPDAGRDPRDNALAPPYDFFLGRDLWGFRINTNATETLPFAFKRLGGIADEDLGPTATRGIRADFESLAQPFERDSGGPEFDSLYAMAGAYETPYEGKRSVPPTTFMYATGYDAIVPSFTNLWWHPAAGDGQWAIGMPVGTNPPSARSGRWCFGTDLDSTYNNNSVCELYSPIFDLTVPAADSTDGTNPNGFYLVFYEWLALADSGDRVRIECVRPGTAADIVTRRAGTFPVKRPNVIILPDRNNAANTAGEWRRMVVSLEPIFNETKLYLKFVLESNATGKGYGWYIDDVTILQAGELSGLVSNAANSKVYLYGTNSIINVPIQETETDSGGSFGFDGLIPAGNYTVYGANGTVAGAIPFGGPSGTWLLTDVNLAVANIVVGITVNSPALLAWNTVPGAEYLIEYATPESLATANPWSELLTITASSPFTTYRDNDSDGKKARYYRISLVTN